jgi:hypothetical protein
VTSVASATAKKHTSALGCMPCFNLYFDTEVQYVNNRRLSALLSLHIWHKAAAECLPNQCRCKAIQCNAIHPTARSSAAGDFPAGSLLFKCSSERHL